MAGSAGAIALGAITFFAALWPNLPTRKRTVMLVITCLLATMTASTVLTLEPGASVVWTPADWYGL